MVTMETCGPEGACSRRLYPSSVVQAVRAAAKSAFSSMTSPEAPISVDESLKLDSSMKSANFKDATVRQTEFDFSHFMLH